MLYWTEDTESIIVNPLLSLPPQIRLSVNKANKPLSLLKSRLYWEFKEVKEGGAKWVNKQLTELLDKVNQTVRKREKFLVLMSRTFLRKLVLLK